MKRICIFGDSITWGMGLPTGKGWADLLRNYLEATTDYYLELYNLGVDKDTSSNLLARIETESQARQPDTVIILIGINDSSFYLKDGQEVAQTTEQDFKSNLESIIHKVQKFTGQIIFIGQAIGDDTLTNPLPRSTTGKRYTKARANKYNDIIKEVAEKNSKVFVGIISALQEGDFIDGLHPNESGHRKIFLKVRQEFAVMVGDMDKEIVVVDKDDNVIGTKQRKLVGPQDIYRVSALWVTNRQGQVLLAQRKWTKANDPGLWGPAVAGTVEANETYESNMYKEAAEEIGLTEIKLVMGPKKLIEGERLFWAQGYFANIDKEISEFKIQETEVEQLAWFDKNQLSAELKSNPEKFIPSAKYWPELFGI